jgi:hypothetical protein
MLFAPQMADLLANPRRHAPAAPRPHSRDLLRGLRSPRRSQDARAARRLLPARPAPAVTPPAAGAGRAIRRVHVP